MLTQLQFLNYLLKNKDSNLITVKGLTEDNFPNYKKEFNYIVNHIKKYGVVPDPTTFISVFPNFEIIELNESIDYILNELHREKSERLLAKTFNKIRDLLVDGKTEEAMNLFITSAQNVSANKHLEAVNILTDIDDRYNTYVDKCNDFSKYYISTGFKELDSILGGWDRYEEYATIAARSGIGKTWVMLKSITAAVDRGLNVGVFSGEMSVNKLAYRFDTLMSHISNGKLMHGNEEVSNVYKKYLDNLKINHKGSLYVLTRDMIDGDANVTALRGFIEKYNLDILFIDQMSLLDGDKYAKASYEKIAGISKEIKVLQVTKHIPIIMVSQQNRSSVNDGEYAGTQHIAGSDRLAQDSTVIIFLTQEDSDAGRIMTMNIAKSRDGGTGQTLKYAINLDKGVFDYIAEDGESGEDLENRYTVRTNESGERVF